MKKQIWQLNEQALTVSFGNEINVQLNRQVQQLFQILKRETYSFIVDMVPTYTGLTIYFDPKQMNYKQMGHFIEEKLKEMSQLEVSVESRLIHIPVYYDGQELERVAQYNELTKNEVVLIHECPIYLVYMIGFLPGFPYLGGLDNRIATPRLKEPKPSIKAGSVGIANNQTGIYPVSSPGGWNIIGHTPVKIFDIQKEQPFMFQAGDYIKFEAIDEQAYNQILNNDDFKPRVEWFDAD